MAEVVYLLCALTSGGYALALSKNYLQRRTRALLWGSLGFLGLGANNLVLFLDFVIWPQADLSLLRAALGAAASLVLAIGLAWDSERELMVPFLNGIAATASMIAGILFWRFWGETRDRLFAWFAIAFWMFAVNWTLIGVFAPANEARVYAYLPRLIGFVLIITAIIDRNRRP